MNNYQFTQTQSTGTPNNVTPSPSPGEVFDLAANISSVFFVIGFIIFILWVWSLISTISLNAKFSKFLEEHRLDTGRDPYTGYVVPAKDELVAAEVQEDMQKDDVKKKKQSRARIVILASVGGVLIAAALAVLLLTR